MKSKTLFLIWLLLFSKFAAAQHFSDTLSWEGFLNIVKKNHPVTTRAKLLEDLSRARRTQAWGGFDPKVSVDHDRKVYDGTNYYSFLTPEVKLPLWFGMELKANYSQAEGAYINPENKLPKEGLSYAGLEIPLGKGLLADKRRAALRQARIFEQASSNEQVNMMNNLFMDAGESYINWQNKFRILKTYENAFSLAKVRFEAVKNGFTGGDKPAIDTTEALTQLQQREQQLQQAQLELQQAMYELSSYLWLDQSIPVDPDKLHIIPSESIHIKDSPALDISSNPKLLSYSYKLRDLEIERRVKAQNLLPEFGVQLGVLNQGRTPLQNLNADYWNDNNKIRLRFSIPLTLSSARGELAESKIKIMDTRLEQDLVRNSIQAKARQNAVELGNLQAQLQLLQQTFKANQQLLKGEEIRFQLGESSLFMVNSRESKLLELNEKLTNTEAKIQKAKLKALWLSGELNSSL